MAGKSDLHNFDDVCKRELQEIIKRRRVVGIPVQEDADGEAEPPRDNLTGLAFSGGGVRSASFNLGLMQALYQRGVLKNIDYLSTISGGGYVGSILSSLALHPDTEFRWDRTGKTDQGKTDQADAPADPEGEGRRFPLSPARDGRQPERVLDLIHGGHYLRRPLIFLNRYLIGVLLTNVVALSLVIAVASLAAWGFRYIDHTWMINWLYALGFQGDIGRAFFPTTLCFFLWVLMWAISYWRRGAAAEGRVARWFMTLTIVSFLLALASLLGTGDVSLVHLRDNYGIEPPTDVVRSVSQDLKTYFLVALALALIPYLRIKDLLRSGTHPRTAVEGWIFGIASRALLYGIPLVIFGWLAQENLSLFNENRHEERFGVRFNTQYDLVPLEFQDWQNTWQEVELQATERNADANEARFAVSRRLWQAVDADDVDQSIAALQSITRFDLQASLLGRWVQYAGYLITGQSNNVTGQFQDRETYLRTRWKVCDQLTQRVLVDPTFYQSFTQVENTLPIESPGLPERVLNERIRIINALVAEAELLERKIDDVTQDDIPYAEWLKQRNQVLATLAERERTGNRDNVADLRSQLRDLMDRGEGAYARLESEVKAMNWRLLKDYWGDRLAPKSTVYSMVVLDADQQTRWAWFSWSLLFFLISSCVVNMNATSLHGFYRNTLANMWITDTPGFGRKIPLARLETVARGAPYHLIGATVHMLGRQKEKERSNTDVFLFSQAFCGSTRTHYQATESYLKGHYDLANAIALSGGAVSPTQVHNPLLAVLLMLSNSRLGQWLPNPGHRVLIPDWLDRILSWFPPVPLRLLIGAAQHAEQRNYCFVSDGGHHENLGLESLLLRRCKVIIASDATCDGHYEFCDLVRLLRRMRFEQGIRIVGLHDHDAAVPLDALTPNRILHGSDDDSLGHHARLSAECHADSHYFVARILYPPGGPKNTPSEGYLLFIKPNFTGDEDLDLLRYQLENAAFPNDPTSDQFYDPQKFESYRELGYHIGQTVCDEQFAQLDSNKPPQGSPLGHWVPTAESSIHASSVANAPDASPDPASNEPSSTEKSKRHPK